MKAWYKIIWVVAIIINFSGVIWFFLGTTANFQRNINLEGRLGFVFLVMPSLLLTLTSIIFIVKNFQISKVTMYLISLPIIFMLILLTTPIIKSVDTRGWITEIVNSVPYKLTSDGRYEYRIELVNSYQRNRIQRLILKDLNTDEEISIRLNIFSDAPPWLHTGVGDWAYGTLSTTQISHQYELITNTNLGVPPIKMIIDVETKTAKELSQ